METTSSTKTGLIFTTCSRKDVNNHRHPSSTAAAATLIISSTCTYIWLIDKFSPT